MLIAALTVADHFEQEKETFVNEMPAWSDPFIADFRATVELILTEYFGSSSREELQEQTNLVNELTEKAKDDLEMVKTQIERGFRNDLKEQQSIIQQLGFRAYWSKASRNNQSEMIGLLLTFSSHLDEAMRTKLEQHQVNPGRLTNIMGYADTLNQANITQESLKGSSKLDTKESISALNDAYAQAMDICAIGKSLFKHEPVKRELFVFSKLVKSQGTPSPRDNEEVVAPS
jgi:hypothetical protein